MNDQNIATLIPGWSTPHPGSPLEEEINDLRRRVEERDTIISEKSTKLWDNIETIRELRTANDQLLIKNARLSVALDSTRAALGAKPGEYVVGVATQLRKDLDEAGAKIEEQAATIQKIHSHLNLDHTCLQEHEKTLQSLRNQLFIPNGTSLPEAIGNLRKERNDARAKVSEQDTEIRKLRREILDIRDKLSALPGEPTPVAILRKTNAIADYCDRVIKLESDLVIAGRRIDYLENDRKTFQRRITELVAECKQKDNQISTLVSAGNHEKYIEEVRGILGIQGTNESMIWTIQQLQKKAASKPNYEGAKETLDVLRELLKVKPNGSVVEAVQRLQQESRREWFKFSYGNVGYGSRSWWSAQYMSPNSL